MGSVTWGSRLERGSELVDSAMRLAARTALDPNYASASGLIRSAELAASAAVMVRTCESAVDEGRLERAAAFIDAGAGLLASAAGALTAGRCDGQSLAPAAEYARRAFAAFDDAFAQLGIRDERTAS